MRGSARHEEINDALRFGGKHRRLGSQGIGRGPAGSRDAGGHEIAVQQKRKSRGSDAHSCLS